MRRLEVALLVALSSCATAPKPAPHQIDATLEATKEECRNAIGGYRSRMADAKNPCEELMAIQGAAIRAIGRCSGVNNESKYEAYYSLKALEQKCDNGKTRRTVKINPPVGPSLQ